MHDLTANIETGRPVIAANLEELRYLVFHGMTGDAGQSAYDLAVELGFEGTEAQWLASLKGADGKNYGIVVDGSADNILELKSVETDGGQGGALSDGILFDNPANLLNFPDRETVYNGVTYRSCSDRPRIYLNGTATATTIVNLDNGETVSKNSEAKTAWGGNTLDWLAVGKRYKLVWRCVSGTYQYRGTGNPAITVRDSNAEVILSNARGAVLLSNPASFTQLYFYKNTVFNECWFEASVIETDTDEPLEQSSASMMLNANIALPQVSSLIDELSYTIPAEVTATGSFTDANGYAEGGCTDGTNTIYYVRFKGNTTTPTFVKATASGEVQATSSPSGVQFVHSNGMACNPTTGEVLVIPLDTSGNNAVHFLSAENLSYIRTINFGDSLREYAPDMTYFTAAAWDATKQLYVFLLSGKSAYVNPTNANAEKKVRGFAFYDAEFNFVKCIRFDRRLTIPGYNDFDVTDTTFGGVYTDADYIYTTVHKSSGDVVAVFDWDGLLVGTFSAAFGHELEWMGRLGDGSWVFGYGSTVNGVTHVDVCKAKTSAWRQVLKSTVRSQFKPYDSTGQSAVGWTQISTGTGGDLILSAGDNISAVSEVRASYCAALGLVRFLIAAMADRISTASPTSPGTFEIAFASASKYKPSCMEIELSGSGYSEGAGCGSVSGYYDTEVVPCAIVSADGDVAFNAETKRDHGASTILWLSGFYYTEDIPAGGES